MTLELFFNGLEALADILYPMELEKVDVLIGNIISNLS